MTYGTSLLFKSFTGSGFFPNVLTSTQVLKRLCSLSAFLGKEPLLVAELMRNLSYGASCFTVLLKRLGSVCIFASKIIQLLIILIK